MATGKELKEKFWESLRDSPFVMLGLAGAREAHTQPMTAQFSEEVPDTIYFFTNTQNSLVKALSTSHDAVISFSAKDHDLFACIHGHIGLDNDRAMIDRFWSPIVSAWYTDGKDDANLALLRFDAGAAQIWNASTGSFLKYMAAGLFGENAEDEAHDNVVKTNF